MRTMSKKLVSCVIRQEDYVLDRRTPQDAIGAKPSLVRTHELGRLVLQTFSEEFTQLRLFCVKRVAFLCVWLRDSGNRQPAVFALHVKWPLQTHANISYIFFGSNLSKKGVTFYVFLVGTHGLEDTLVRYIFDHNSMGPRNALIRKENLITFLAISSSLSSTSLLDHLG